ncbi:MAG TPA: SDR family oxidoreductase [Chloroflexia bacterium]|nr:SDR family oxidoreductase [Chloroflexia bacterium]
MQRILIVGANSAIAHETAKLFARDGAQLFLIGRDSDKLSNVADDLKVRGAGKIETAQADLANLDSHQALFDQAVQALDGLDAILIAHGTLPDQGETQASVEATIREFTVNSVSVISLLTIAANYFEQQKRGTIAAIGSVAGDRGRQSNYIYGAAKASIEAYMQGLRNRLYKAGVSVLIIKPGTVDTPMTAGFKKGPLFASPQKVAQEIHDAMLKGKDVLYTPFYWRYIMLIIKSIPEPVFKRLNLKA